jgi:mono/diheme cytochrome c family protein
MKSYATLSVLIIIVFAFSYCSSSKGAAKKSVSVTYAGHVQTLIAGNCSPCHIPEKGGKKKAYDSYASVKGDIDEIIRRIELHPGEKGFMPFKKERLSDSTIALFREWKSQGMAE